MSKVKIEIISLEQTVQIKVDGKDCGTLMGPTSRVKEVIENLVDKMDLDNTEVVESYAKSR